MVELDDDDDADADDADDDDDDDDEDNAADAAAEDDLGSPVPNTRSTSPSGNDAWASRGGLRASTSGLGEGGEGGGGVRGERSRGREGGA